MMADPLKLTTTRRFCLKGQISITVLATRIDIRNGPRVRDGIAYRTPGIRDFDDSRTRTQDFFALPEPLPASHDLQDGWLAGV
ncbi:hypothetical protein VTK73DRAFT_156 [Phialemonium thermophilum]|uniref:Uncharacterized protein n=1 Tax=Phialemonium thermophilum TaxID=223376 RepID=A0ABR3VWR2_9PEZI